MNAQSNTAKVKADQASAKATTARRRALALAAAATLLINLVAAYFLYQSMVVKVEAQQLERLSQTQAQQQSDAVQRYTLGLQKTLQELARSPDLAGALTFSEQTLRWKVAAKFDELIGVRAIAQGAAALDREHSIPISFAELDMIQRAENGQAVPPESRRVEGNWRLQLVEPLPSPPSPQPNPAPPGAATSDTTPAQAPEAPETLGVLLLSLTTDKLAAALGDSALGKTELLQQFNPAIRPQVLVTAGAGEAGPTLEREVAQSPWRVSFTPAESLRQQAAVSLLPLLALLAGLLLATGLLAVWLAKHLTREPVAAVAVTEVAAEPENIDILDIDMHDADADVLGLQNTTTAPEDTPAPDTAAPSIDVPEVIFRAYDIRGIVGEQWPISLAQQIGQALGSEVLEQGESSIVVARDARTHSPEITELLIKGLLDSGCDVINLGVVPTPLMHFATSELSETSSGVMVTASHNPATYNGFKLVVNGRTLADQDVLALRTRILHGPVHEGQGREQHRDLVPDYIERIFSDVALAGDVHIVLDCANAVTANVAPQLFEELGCEVTPLFCELDGSFPNHDPDPTQIANLQVLIAKVAETGADLGVAFDGDGDRLTVVTPAGEIIWADRLLMLFAKDIVARNPGADVLFDVKCTRQLNSLISGYGGRPVMWKSGHSHMKAKMVETGALLGGELSGHIFIKDRWYGFDDGMYAAARMLEIMTMRDQDLDTLFQAFPQLPITPELKIAVAEERKFSLVDELIARGDFSSGKINTIDGLRVDFAKGWGLVRASNTSAALTLRFEGETQETLEQLQSLFRRELRKIDATLAIDF